MVARARVLRMRATVHVDDPGVRPPISKMWRLISGSSTTRRRTASELAKACSARAAQLVPGASRTERAQLKRRCRARRSARYASYGIHTLCPPAGADNAAALVARRRAGRRLVRGRARAKSPATERGDRDRRSDRTNAGAQRQAFSCGAGCRCRRRTSVFTDDAASSVVPGSAGGRERDRARVHARRRCAQPSILTCSPILSVVRCQPLRCKPCGGPSSAPQFAT